MMAYQSSSPAQTKTIGRQLGRRLKRGDVIALTGDLGAGKTTLVKGIAAGLGLPREADVQSPSFVLVREYRGREKIYHLDWYRLKRVTGPDALLSAECWEAPGVTVIEWADRGAALLPEDHLLIRIMHDAPNARRIEFHPRGAFWRDRLKVFSSAQPKRLRRTKGKP